MSLAILKRKSRRFQAKISGKDANGFSINGGHRNQGWVGQTSHGRHLSKTPFKGNIPKGNGGLYGNYKKSIVNGIYCCTNDPSIIKKSNMNNTALLLSRVENPTPVFIPNCEKSCLNNRWYKNLDPVLSSQGFYIKHKKAKKDLDDKCCDVPSSPETKSKICPCPNTVKKYDTVDYNTYMEHGLMIKNRLPTPVCLKHFPITVNHNSGCNINYNTPEEAIAAGLLPANWMKC